MCQAPMDLTSLGCENPGSDADRLTFGSPGHERAGSSERRREQSESTVLHREDLPWFRLKGGTILHMGSGGFVNRGPQPH